MQWSHRTVLVSQLALTVAPYSWNLSVQCSYHSQFDEVVNLRTEPEALDVTALAFLHSQDSHAFKYIHSAYSSYRSFQRCSCSEHRVSHNLL